jgi:uncharacterized membrane protein YuzA (DUF378 family)
MVGENMIYVIIGLCCLCGFLGYKAFRTVKLNKQELEDYEERLKNIIKQNQEAE